jgi:mono/diheme cytochrome c family protein
MLALTPASAMAQEPAQRGRALLQQFCAPCHAIGKTGASPHADAPPLRKIGSTFDLDTLPQVLERGISSGHPDMPEFKFNEQAAHDVRAYLRTIQE